MASLIFAASFLTYNKIKEKREAKKAAKREGYQKRYNELEKEHSQIQEKYMQRQATGDRSPITEIERSCHNLASGNDNYGSKDTEIGARRKSTDSQRSSQSSGDDPSAWVEHVTRTHR